MYAYLNEANWLVKYKVGDDLKKNQISTCRANCLKIQARDIFNCPSLIFHFLCEAVFSDVAFLRSKYRKNC